MIKKALFVLVVLVSIQLFSSCLLFITDCPETSTFEINYNSVEITAQNTAGFNTNEVNDTVYKNAFGLSIYADFEATQIAQLNRILVDFAFSTCTALSCDGDTWVYKDDIKDLEIFITDTDTGTKYNATELFGVMPYYEEDILSVSEYMLQRSEGMDGFQFELIDFESIPNSAIFNVELELESGTIFENETPVIHFY